MLPNTIALNPGVGYVGQIAEPDQPYSARSKRCEGSGVAPGMPVKRGTNKEKQVKAFATGDTLDAYNLAGIVVLETSRPFEQAPLLSGDGCAVMRQGAILMNFAEAVNAGEDVVLDVDDGLLYGAAAADSLGSGQFRVPGCRIEQTISAAGLAVVEVSLSSSSTQDGTVTGGLTASGDLAAAGGFRRTVGAFVRDNVAASLTASPAAVGATAAPELDRAMPRAGSVMGISLSATVAPAGSTMTIEVYKNGALLNAACKLDVPAGAALGHFAVFAKDLYTFAAGDRLGIAITTDGSWTSTTTDIAVDIEVEC